MSVSLPTNDGHIKAMRFNRDIIVLIFNSSMNVTQKLNDTTSCSS